MTVDPEELGLPQIKTLRAIPFPVAKETWMKVIFGKL
jgi:hypothetical protein